MMIPIQPLFAMFLFLAGNAISTACSADHPPNSPESSDQQIRRLLYVASPGIRNYLQYGGHGVVVFDVDNDHQFVRRISLKSYGTDQLGNPLNIKGICGNARTGRMYLSTIRHLICLDLLTDKILWQREFPLGCDRMSMSPDGSIIYQPSFEKDRWYVVDAENGSISTEVVTNSRAHNTVFSVDGREAYLAGLGSSYLTVADGKTHKILRKVGPFSGSIRPFTVNGDSSLVYVNVNGLLGFEIGDLKTGKKLHRVEVREVPRGKPLRHGCPSHGIGMTPDQRQIWVSDGFNSMVHIFDSTNSPPTLQHSVKLRGQPGWVTFSLDGKIGWPSTGQAIDTRTHKIIGSLTDEKGRAVESEKILEVQIIDGETTDGKKILSVGDQFGRGQIKRATDKS